MEACDGRQNRTGRRRAGVIGTNLIEHLSGIGGWDVIGLSRRGGTDTAAVRHLPVDLLEPASLAGITTPLRDVTHVFYAAYQDRPSWAELVEPNVAMLANVLDA